MTKQEAKRLVHRAAVILNSMEQDVMRLTALGGFINDQRIGHNIGIMVGIVQSTRGQLMAREDELIAKMTA